MTIIIIIRRNDLNQRPERKFINPLKDSLMKKQHKYLLSHRTQIHSMAAVVLSSTTSAVSISFHLSATSLLVHRLPQYLFDGSRAEHISWGGAAASKGDRWSGRSGNRCLGASERAATIVSLPRLGNWPQDRLYSLHSPYGSTSVWQAYPLGPAGQEMWSLNSAADR